LGEKCYAELHEIGFDVDIVDVFRRTEDVLPVAKEAISIGAKCLWQQLGIMNTTAHEMAQTAGLISVIDRCIKVDHAQLMT
jgi:predicted CoA-binding protein